MTKSDLGEKGFDLLYQILASKGVREETQDRHPEEGTLEKPCYWPFPFDFLSLLSYVTQNHLSTGGSRCSRLGPPTLILNQENTPRACL